MRIGDALVVVHRDLARGEFLHDLQDRCGWHEACHCLSDAAHLEGSSFPKIPFHLVAIAQRGEGFGMRPTLEHEFLTVFWVHPDLKNLVRIDVVGEVLEDVFDDMEVGHRVKVDADEKDPTPSLTELVKWASSAKSPGVFMMRRREVRGPGPECCNGVGRVQAAMNTRTETKGLGDRSHPGGSRPHIEDRVRRKIVFYICVEREARHEKRSFWAEDLEQRFDDRARSSGDEPKLGERAVHEHDRTALEPEKPKVLGNLANGDGASSLAAQSAHEPTNCSHGRAEATGQDFSHSG